MRFAVCGRGPMGRRYAELISALPGLDLVGVAGRSGWRDLVEREEVDAVVVASAPASHAELAVFAMQAGRDVLCEKPLTLDVASARMLRDEAVRRRRRLLTGHTYLWHPGFEAVRVAAGGRSVLRVETDSGNRGPVRRDVSVLWDYGPHDVAMALALMGGPPDDVAATREVVEQGEVWVLTLRWPGGREAELRFSNALAERRRRLRCELDWGGIGFEDVRYSSDLESRPLTRLLRSFAAGASDPDLGVAVVDVLARAEALESAKS